MSLKKSIALRFIAVALFWYLWRAAPSLPLCIAYWLSILAALEPVLRSKTCSTQEKAAFFFGVLSNAIVTIFNGGIMPVVGMPSTFIPASRIWSGSLAGSHFLFLADNSRFDFFSVGDLLLISGIIFFAVRKTRNSIQRRLSHVS